MDLRWIPVFLLLTVSVVPSASALHEFMPCQHVSETCPAQDIVEYYVVKTYYKCEEVANEHGRSCDVNIAGQHLHSDGTLHFHPI